MQGLYAVSFSVTPGAELDEAFRGIADLIARWGWRGDGPVPDITAGTSGEATFAEFRLTWQMFAPEGTDQRALTVELRHPDSRRPGLEWSTWLELTRDIDRLRVTARLAQEATELALMPAALDLHRPAVIPRILTQFPCAAGGVPLIASAVTLAPDDVDSYVDTVLGSADRALPVVLLSAPAGGAFLADPERCADELAGIAHIAALSGHLAWERLTARLRRDEIVPRGGARLYWPEFGFNQRLRHRFWTATRLRTLGEREFVRELFGTLSRLSVRGVPHDPLVPILRRSIDDQRLAAVREQAAEADPELTGAYEAEISGLEADLALIAAERDEAREEAQRLRAEVVAYRESYASALAAAITVRMIWLTTYPSLGTTLQMSVSCCRAMALP